MGSAGCSCGFLYLHLDSEIAQPLEEPGGQPGFVLLREVLVRYQSSAFLDIELKISGLEKITAEILRMFPPARGC